MLGVDRVRGMRVISFIIFWLINLLLIGVAVVCVVLAIFLFDPKHERRVRKSTARLLAAGRSLISPLLKSRRPRSL
jgi:hypothetical protein